jgi:galactokinase/mevalonate kinase-like predicted kinase
LRAICKIPYRIDLAGGWLDQPAVSKRCAGAVLTISIEPDYDFNDRSGMATSSRKKAIELWQVAIPAGDKEKLAKNLFCFVNPPGSTYISGSQDALGIVIPGLNRLHYNGEFWPSEVETITDNTILQWLEKRLWLIPLYPRNNDYNVLSRTHITAAGTKILSEAANLCWNAIKERNITKLGDAMRRSFEAQIAMFPLMASTDILDLIEKYKTTAQGWKLSGAGGGGYLILVSEKAVEKAIQIRIRRE